MFIDATPPGSTQIVLWYLQDIMLNNVKLEHTSSIKLLELHIQTDLAWKEHINYLCFLEPVL